MEKELIELFDAVKRAADAAAVDGGADSSPEESRCLEALKRLKKFPVNYQVLVSTQVGKRLRTLTKHPREKIQALASDVVKNWKTIIVRETMKNKNGNEVNGESIKAECAGDDGYEGSKFQRVNSVKVEKVSRVENVTVERSSKSLNPKSERALKSESSFTDVKSENATVMKTENTTSKSVKIEKKPKDEKLSSNVASAVPPKLSALVYCKDSVRDKVRELLAEALCKVSVEVDDDLRDAVNDCDPYSHSSRILGLGAIISGSAIRALGLATAITLSWACSLLLSDKLRWVFTKGGLMIREDQDFATHLNRRRVFTGSVESITLMTSFDNLTTRRSDASILRFFRTDSIFSDQTAGGRRW